MLFERFENLEPYYKQRRNGGIGAFTPDNVPIFDHLVDNAFVIADSNHGFKMIGVGKLTASMLVHGNKPEELRPFTYGRYAAGDTGSRSERDVQVGSAAQRPRGRRTSGRQRPHQGRRAMEASAHPTLQRHGTVHRER